MAKWMSFPALALLLAAWAGPDQEKGSRQGGPCDLKMIQMVPYCTTCKTVDPQLDPDGQHCGARPKDVEVCLKTYTECTKCSSKNLEDIACCADAKKEKRTDKSLVLYRCEGCGMKGEREGPCIGESCIKAGKKVKRSCEKSGTFPHVSP